MVNFIKSYLEEGSSKVQFNSTWEVVSFVIDLCIVAYIVYKIIVISKETRAWQLLKGVAIVLIAAKVASIVGLKYTSGLLNAAIYYIALAFVVLFQPELRRVLEQIGNNRLDIFFDIKKGDKVLKKNLMIEEIAKAVSNLSKNSIGALIIYERETKLGEIINTGTKLDANISSELLENIFIPNTPLHDGALVIRDDKIVAAACFLGLTDNKNISKRFGTRHRAAMGITEISDCLAVTVSEENSKISFFINGKMYHDVSIETLKEYLTKTIIEYDSHRLHLKKKHSIIDSFIKGIKSR